MNRAPSLNGRPEERYVARWQHAWAHGQVGPCLDEHAATIRDEHTLYVQPLFDAAEGERGMRRQFEPVFALIPDLRAKLDGWLVADGVALIEFTLTGTLGGKPLCLRGVDRMQLDGEQLVTRYSYYDPLPLLVALLTRPRAWPRALSSIRAGMRPRIRPTRTPRAQHRDKLIFGAKRSARRRP